jgi:hypothetical protein
MSTDSTTDDNSGDTGTGTDTDANRTDDTVKTLNTIDQTDVGLFELTRSKLLLGALLLSGIAGSGLARRALAEAGYNDLGVIIYTLGYAGMVFAVWFGWIRPLDITGPTGR